MHASTTPERMTDMDDMRLVRNIEEMLLTSWPSFEEVFMDGWIVRFASGYTRRSNSVQAIYPSYCDTAEKVRRCEELYAAAGLSAAFKITPLAQSAQLDPTLESKGYRECHRTSVQVLDVLPKTVSGHGGADIVLATIDRWLDEFSTVSAKSEDKMKQHSAIVRSIPMPSCMMIAYQDGKPVACARGVLSGKYVGLYDVCTSQSARRNGFASHVIRAILSWASEHCAEHAYLCVEEENSPAIGLYGKLGFKNLYTYWYRAIDVGCKYRG